MQENDKEKVEAQVFSVIKELLPFLYFVKNHPATLVEHKAKADAIQHIIQNIETIKTAKSWCIRFAIYNEKLIREPKEGLNRYDWRASLESGILSIEAERRFYPFSVKTLNYIYSFHYNFRTGRLSDAGDKPMNVFIEDVLKFKDYMSSKLPDIETEIEIFE
ncbi:MAG: hypothetical protein JST09_07025 [Bacteroidetes bacterium]|nr:hypothetical protein [Bacteroidota bacterium]MBS1607559.1 hypothetical protein [Bacteroidota bacterium]